jgi:hypothetical protein
MIDISNIEIKLKSINKNYKKIYNFIFLYKEELINIINDNNSIILLNQNINNQNIDKIIKKIDIELENIHDLSFKTYINIYKQLKKLEEILNINIKYINQIDIYEKQYLISDTSKNNINKNKELILDLYKKYNEINTNLLNECNKLIFQYLNLQYNYKQLLEIIYNEIINNTILIDLYLDFIKEIKLLNVDNNILYLINKYNNTIQQHLLLYELEKNNIKSNSNITLFTNNKLFNNNYYTLKKINIINDLNKFNLKKKYKILSDLILDTLNIKKFSNINYKDFDKMSTIVNLFYKMDKIPLIIVIIKTDIDDINYNLSNLMNNKEIIESKIGINNKFINKTKTIMTKNEYSKELLQNNNNYISKIDNITVIHNKVLYNKYEKIQELNNILQTPVLLINYDNNYYNLYSNSQDNLIKLEDIQYTLLNEPNYIIENYNNILNSNIINKINSYNIYEKYLENIQNTYDIYSNINHIELKNIIVNEIKKIKLTINNENKIKIIDLILEIINDKIYNYIIKKTNIKLESELFLIYLSNINSLLNKFKKELVDNYNSDLIINIDNIINNQYNNIQQIIDNIIDKLYAINI